MRSVKRKSEEEQQHNRRKNKTNESREDKKNQNSRKLFILIFEFEEIVYTRFVERNENHQYEFDGKLKTKSDLPFRHGASSIKATRVITFRRSSVSRNLPLFFRPLLVGRVSDTVT